MRHALALILQHAATAVAANTDLDAEVTQLLDRLMQVLQDHGPDTVMACLSLLPLAQAKGDSKAEIDLMIDRFDRGLMANAFISLDPSNRRFPCEVVGTGRIGAHGITGATTQHRAG